MSDKAGPHDDRTLIDVFEHLGSGGVVVEITGSRREQHIGGSSERRQRSNDAAPKSRRASSSKTRTPRKLTR